MTSVYEKRFKKVLNSKNKIQIFFEAKWNEKCPRTEKIKNNKNFSEIFLSFKIQNLFEFFVQN